MCAFPSGSTSPPRRASVTINVRVSTTTRHTPARPERGLFGSPPGDINATTPDMRVGVCKRAANFSGLRGMRAAPVMLMASVTYSADNKRRKGRRATRVNSWVVDSFKARNDPPRTLRSGNKNHSRPERQRSIRGRGFKGGGGQTPMPATRPSTPRAIHLSQWARGALRYACRHCSMVPSTS